MKLLTTQELRVIDRLSDAYDAFNALPVAHASDLIEFEQAIHRAQNIVMARAAIRAFPKNFRREEEFK